VTFDPFGDFETVGYLRNFEKEKAPVIVKRLEHASFTTDIDDAFTALAGKKPLTYADVLSTHEILFDAFYPWAGQDRCMTSRRSGAISATAAQARRATGREVARRGAGDTISGPV
jgi:cell filamentation protein